MEYPLPERFEVLEERERTGSKVLLRAWDKTLEREVVLQLLGTITRRGSDPREQLREARMMGRVHHRGVCRLLEALETDAGPVMVLEPLEGETLAERLERVQTLDAEEVRRMGVEVAEALAAVHAQGVEHRGN
jgi:serine/threonine protein kinase